jgi:creatinine amidohydrolase/Fe(II)-dependent formamide hydrolase-like protein
MGWHVQDLNPHGAVGRADQADARRGQALLESVRTQLALLLTQLIDFEPLN